ncbi:MAG: WbqC family protein [Bacteroidia bacterium]
MINTAAILPLTVLGPVQWYSKFLLHNEIGIDLSEHYVKQTWRNRMRIDGANGSQDLSIPVQLPLHKTPVNEVRIDRHTRWQQQHWRAIASAYGKSPYFEFYADYFEPFYAKPHPDLLTEFSLPLLDLSLKLLKWEKKYILLNTFEKTENKADYRTLISPKKLIENDAAFAAAQYAQVFGDRFAFRPNFSVIDLLCCCGPASAEIITNSIVFPK